MVETIFQKVEKGFQAAENWSSFQLQALKQAQLKTSLTEATSKVRYNSHIRKNLASTMIPPFQPRPRVLSPTHPSSSS